MIPGSVLIRVVQVRTGDVEEFVIGEGQSFSLTTPRWWKARAYRFEVVQIGRGDADEGQ